MSSISADHPLAGGLAEGSHPFPYRTRSLSPPARMVLPGRLGGRVRRRQPYFERPRRLARAGGGVRVWGAATTHFIHRRDAERAEEKKKKFSLEGPPRPLRLCGENAVHQRNSP